MINYIYPGRCRELQCDLGIPCLRKYIYDKNIAAVYLRHLRMTFIVGFSPRDVGEFLPWCGRAKGTRQITRLHCNSVIISGHCKKESSPLGTA